MAIDEETPLVDENSPQIQPLNHTRDVYILSSAFLLIFLAYGAIQNLESTINTEGDLGTTSLGILYLSFTFFSIIAPLVVRKLGSKNALILGTSGYMLFTAANLLPSWYTMVPSSLYLGFAASIIWVGQGTYITSAANSNSNDNNLPERMVIGQFNGVFWGMFASHQLIGNLINLAVLRDETGGSTSGTTLLFIMFLCSMTLGTILMFFLNRRNGKEKRLQDLSATFSSTVVSSLKSLLDLLLDRRILLLIPLIAYSGFQQAFVWAEYTKEIVKPVLGEQGVGGAMAVYGVFDAICSLVAGRLTSGLASITIIVFGGASIQVLVLLWLLLNYSVTGGVLATLLPLTIGALWGIGDGVFNTQLSALLGILFKHDLEGAFAQLKLWQSVSISIFVFIGTSISLQTMVVIMLVALCISVAAFLFLTIRVEKAFSHSVSLQFLFVLFLVVSLEATLFFVGGVVGWVGGDWGDGSAGGVEGLGCGLGHSGGLGGGLGRGNGIVGGSGVCLGSVLGLGGGLGDRSGLDGEAGGVLGGGAIGGLGGEGGLEGGHDVGLGAGGGSGLLLQPLAMVTKQSRRV